MDFDTTLSDEASLGLSELEELASEIRDVLIGDRGVTIEQFVERAKNITQFQLGYRKTKAILSERRLRGYFPDEVFDALLNGDIKNGQMQFNDSDNEFLRGNYGMGSKWLSQKFYTSPRSIRDHLREIHVQLHNPRKGFKKHIYTKEENKYILEHLNESPKKIAEELDLSYEGVSRKMRRLRKERDAKETQNES